MPWPTHTDLIHCLPSLNCSSVRALLSSNPQTGSWPLLWQRWGGRKLLAISKVKTSVLKDRDELFCALNVSVHISHYKKNPQKTQLLTHFHLNSLHIRRWRLNVFYACLISFLSFQADWNPFQGWSVIISCVALLIRTDRQTEIF